MPNHTDRSVLPSLYLEHHMIIIKLQYRKQASKLASTVDSCFPTIHLLYSTGIYVTHFIFIKYIYICNQIHTHTWVWVCVCVCIPSIRLLLNLPRVIKDFYFYLLQYQFSCFELHNDFSFEVKGQSQGEDHFTVKLEI